MIILTREFLNDLAPRPRKGGRRQRAWDGYVGALTSAAGLSLLEDFGITNANRLAHLLANWCAETGGFQIIHESGAYSAKRVMQIFGVGKHSAKVRWHEANRLAYNGPALFDRVYGIGNPRKARELGNKDPGDGWKYRGVGIVQITGRRDHYRYAAKIGVPVGDLAKPLPSIHAALLEWDNKNLNPIADKDDTKRVRRAINGGYNGMAHVRMYLARAKRLITEEMINENGEKMVAEAPPGALELGSEGERVSKLQEQLKEHGYPVGDVDGIFGPLTEKALVAFRMDNGFQLVGKLHPSERDVIAALEEAPKAEPEIVIRDVSKEELKERGSETLAQTSFWKRVMGWIFGGSAAAAADTTSGLGLIGATLEKAEAVRNAADRTTSILSWMPSWHVIVILTLAIMAFLVYRAFDRIEKRRVADAQSGAHLGR